MEDVGKARVILILIEQLYDLLLILYCIQQLLDRHNPFRSTPFLLQEVSINRQDSFISLDASIYGFFLRFQSFLAQVDIQLILSVD